MSDVDFEVHPRGTTEELHVLRDFSKKMIDVTRTMKNPVEKWEEMTKLVRQLEEFYDHHVETYPV